MEGDSPLFQRKKGAAEQPDEGVQRGKFAPGFRRHTPSPVAFGDTLSLWERGSEPL
jgi:hypothetical protein